MASLQQRLSSIEVKTQMLLAKYAGLRAAKAAADERCDNLLRQVEQQSREIADLRRQVEYLRVTTTIAPTRDAVEQSRAVISELVREIDKCIADLTTGHSE